jgi:hypothetical protein
MVFLHPLVRGTRRAARRRATPGPRQGRGRGLCGRGTAWAARGGPWPVERFYVSNIIIQISKSLFFLRQNRILKRLEPPPLCCRNVRSG